MGDGDGFASVNGKYLGISTMTSYDFVGALLGTFNVQTRKTWCDVVTRGRQAALVAAEIPMFRFARGRLRNSDSIARIIISKKAISPGQ